MNGDWVSWESAIGFTDNDYTVKGWWWNKSLFQAYRWVDDPQWQAMLFGLGCNQQELCLTMFLFLLVYPNEMRFQWAKWSYFVEVGNPSRRQTHIYILYNPHLATRTAILTVHEDARWWSARNLCGRFLSADLPPLGTLSDIYRWKKPLNQPSVIHLNGIFHCNAHPFSWYLAATKKTVAMCSLEAMDVLQQQHLMVLRALEMLAVFLWTARDMGHEPAIILLWF